MKNKFQKYYLGVFLLAICLLGVLAVTTTVSNVPSTSVSESDGINYFSDVHVYVTRADGTIEDIGHSHNAFTGVGQNMTRDYLKDGGGSPIDDIGLCNATAGCQPASATSTTLENEYSSCGLARADGTVATDPSSDGNWSVYKTFTASCNSLATNKTGLFNATTGSNILFAENNFSTVNLNSADQLTINWTIYVS